MQDYSLRKWGDPILRTPCESVEDFSDLDNLVSEMHYMMKINNGIGLAAPQVGDTRRVLIAEIEGLPTVFVNPKIENAWGYVPFLEGCLSLPGLLVPTLRRFRIQVEYQDRQGNSQRDTFSGMDSIVLQHEIDHLNGKLMYHYFK